MVHAEKHARLIGWSQTVLIFLGLIGTFFTIHAALKSLDEMRRANVLTNIPYVTFSPMAKIEIRTRSDEIGPQLDLRVAYEIKAFGNTPAMNLVPQSGFSQDVSHIDWPSVVDSTLFKALVPGETFPSVSSNAISIRGVNLESKEILDRLERSGANINFVKEGQKEFDFSKPIFFHVRCLYSDIMNDQFEMKMIYQVRFDMSSSAGLAVQIIPLRSEFRIIHI